MSVVQEFRDLEIARLEHSGWVTNTALRRRLEVVGLRPPAEVVAECLDEGAGVGDGAGARWERAERAVAHLREHFAPFRFSEEVDYGLLAIPSVDRLDTRGAVEPCIRRGQQPDLLEDFVEPALGEGVDLTGAADPGDLAGTTLGKDGWMVAAGVVGQYGISAGSHEDVTAAPAELFEVDGVDTRALMTRQVWGARLLQCPPGLVPDSDYAERWTFTLFPAEGLVDGRAVSGTVLKKRVRFRLGKAGRGIGSARVSPALPLG
ncbi:hypothetical protein [Actinomyces stomatis]|uniref:hypothetical protein n=1 Tax=Actinomyces stomatis TaxID=3050227 RepID=UPI0028528324|nr:hypothetical protein [Actinomyces sp. PK606]